MLLMKNSSKTPSRFSADLHAARVDDVECSSHALDELENLLEAVVSNAPGTINEEDHIRLGAFAHCDVGTTMLM